MNWSEHKMVVFNGSSFNDNYVPRIVLDFIQSYM